MREFKGVARGILLGTLIIILIIWLLSCGGSSGVTADTSTQIEQRDMTEQEMTWWTEVGNCLYNMGLSDTVDIPEPYIVIMAEPFECGSTLANGCGLEDKIILTADVEAKENWFKHESCHVYDYWLNGMQGHQSHYWRENKTCLCQ